MTKLRMLVAGVGAVLLATGTWAAVPSPAHALEYVECDFGGQYTLTGTGDGRTYDAAGSVQCDDGSTGTYDLLASPSALPLQPLEFFILWDGGGGPDGEPAVSFFTVCRFRDYLPTRCTSGDARIDFAHDAATGTETGTIKWLALYA